MSANRKTKGKYGKLLPKEAEAFPWQKLYVDLIGPYKIPTKFRDNSENESKNK